MSFDLGWVDIAIVVFLVLSVGVGLARGVVFELLSMAGWFAAYFAGRWLTPSFVGHIPVGDPGSSLNYGVTFACVFLVALIAWSIAARIVRALVRATPLSPVDRVLGAGFGLVRGLVVLLVVATVIGISPWGHSAAWRRSQGAAWLGEMLVALRPLFTNDTLPSPTA